MFQPVYDFSVSKPIKKCRNKFSGVNHFLKALFLFVNDIVYFLKKIAMLTVCKDRYFFSDQSRCMECQFFVICVFFCFVLLCSYIEYIFLMSWVVAMINKSEVL